MRYPLVLLLFLLSGAAGLIYELIWVRELIFVFGGTTYAITTVLVAFLGGLGLGSYLAGRMAERLERPGRVYGMLEITIGVYALAIPLLLDQMLPIYRALYAPLSDWPVALALVRFALSVLVLVVPTTLMGATLPILVRYVTGAGGAVGRSVGILYGTNTFGAVIGTMLAGFWLIPRFGLTSSTRIAAAVNLIVGVTGFIILGRAVLRERAEAALAEARLADKAARKVKTPPSGTLATGPDPIRRWLLLGFAVSGFAAMVYQLTWTRTLVMFIGSSTYAYTCILAAFILGLALGSLVIARWADRGDPVTLFAIAELLIGAVAVLIVPQYGNIPGLVQKLVAAHADAYGTLLAWQFVIIVATTLVPTFLMGAVFPLVARALAQGRDESAAAAVGRAYAVNTLGTIVGAFVAGFVLIRSDVLGVQNSIVLASVLNGAVGTGLLLARAPRPLMAKDAAVPVAGLVLIVALGLLGGGWDRHKLISAPYLGRTYTAAADREIVYYKEGVDLTVAVAHPKGNPDGLSLTVNGKPDAAIGYEDNVTQLLLGHLPALVTPPGQDACVIGLGSGMTLAALARHPSYQHLDCAELSEEVIEAARLFAPYCDNVLDKSQVRILRADGRNHLMLTDRMYDLIVSEPSNPWMTGVSNLFTREFFQAARGRLRENGRLAVWLHAYSMSVHDFQMVVRTLFDVFDSVSLWELNATNFLLLAGRTPLRIDAADCAQRFENPAVLSDLYCIAVTRPGQVLGRFIAADVPLKAWCREAKIHTDDNALLEFSAPRYLYVGEQAQLIEQFVALQQPPASLMADSGGAQDALLKEAEAFSAARVAYAKANVTVLRKDLVATLNLLLESHRKFPGHPDVHTAAQYVGHAIRADANLKDQPELIPLFAEAAQIRRPRLANRGATLAQIAAACRKDADTAARTNEWALAAVHLAEARRLQPDDPEIAQALKEALDKAGSSPETAGLRAELPPSTAPALTQPAPPRQP
jgi:spermidine synthase